MKNQLKTLLLTFTLIIALCGSVLATPASAAVIPEGQLSVSASSTKKIELNTGKILFYVGGAFNLRLKNAVAKNVKWQSSNKAVATVNSQGYVIGKKVGKCTITARYKGKQYKCTANVVTNSRFLLTLSSCFSLKNKAFCN